MKDFLKSKKVKVFLITIVMNIITIALMQGFIGKETAEIAFYMINALGGSYIVGQSFADGLSKGKTSSADKKESA